MISIFYPPHIDPSMINLAIMLQQSEGINITAELVVAIGALLTAVLSFVNNKTAEKRTAKKDEVDLLREEVTRLQQRIDELGVENENWRKRYEQLYSYVLLLRKIMVDSQLEVPQMPELILLEETRMRKKDK